MPRSRFRRPGAIPTERLQDRPPGEWFPFLQSLPPERWVALLQTLPAEDWWFVLEILLIRDRELDDVAMRRYQQDRGPEKAPILVAERHRYRLLNKLIKLFRTYNCEGYSRYLVERGLPLPYDPGPEVETAALRALKDWLTPAPAFPRYTTSGEQQDLRELRRCLARAVKNRLHQLEGEADNKADKLKKKLRAIPERVEVLKLAKLVKKGLEKGRSKIDVAREFTEGNEKKAKSLLRQLRRYPRLLE